MIRPPRLPAGHIRARALRHARTAPSASAAANGLRFPSNGESGTDDFGTAYTGDIFNDNNYIAFSFTGANLPASPWPMTYLWRIKPRYPNNFYCTTFFWSDSSFQSTFTANGYYGFHPYPRSETNGTLHDWEIAVAGLDVITDVGAVSTLVDYGRWHTQAARVTNPSGSDLLCEFWWDLGTATTRKIVHNALGNTASFPFGTPGITFGDAPWQRMRERMSATLGAVKICNAALSDADIFAEAADMSQLVTPAAQASRWWFKPTYSSANDLTDAVTGRAPAWRGPARATLEAA